MSSAGGNDRAPGRNGGFTLLEMLIACSLVGLVVTNIVLAMNSSTKAYETGASCSQVEDQARRTLDRIALAVMGSSREGLAPGQEFPLDTSSLTYQLNLGYEDGEPVWSAPERIERVDAGEQVVWIQNPATPERRQVVWSKWVRDYLAGETFNGIDDNGNGLIDEKGLSFTIEENLVTIRLTLERKGPDGRLITVPVETQVNVRN
jgi:prepilin-type N-terminal cleavage/methylation domain-containing protein